MRDEKRCLKKDKQKWTKGRRRRKGGVEKKNGASAAVLTRNTDEAPQWFRDASQVASLWMSNYLNTATENMRQSVRGKGQDYKFSSFRTAERTEVENNPQPYPVRGNSLSHWWQIGCHFQKRLKTKACAQLERSLESTHSCDKPIHMCDCGTSRPITVTSLNDSPPLNRGFALRRAERSNQYMTNTGGRVFMMNE